MADEQEQEPLPTTPIATSWPRTVETAFEWQAGTAAGAQAGLVNALSRSAEPSLHAIATLSSRLRRVSAAAGSPGAGGGGADGGDEEEARAGAGGGGFGSGIEEEEEEEEDLVEEESDDVFFPGEALDDDDDGGRRRGRRGLRPPPAAAAQSDSTSLTQPLLEDGPSTSSRRRSFLLDHGHAILPPQQPASRQGALSAAAVAAANAAATDDQAIATREASLPALTDGSRPVPVRLLLEEADRSGSSSTLAAALNAVNVLCGVGLLAMPFASVQAGWVSFLLLALVAGVALFSGTLLEACMSLADGPDPEKDGRGSGGGALCAAADGRRPQQQRPALLRSFPDLGGAAFGRAGRVLVALLLYLELLSCTVDFLVLEGDNLAALVPPGGWMFPSARGVALFGGALTLTREQAFALLAAAGVLPTVLLRDLSALSYLSAGGILGSLAIVGCLFGSVGGAGAAAAAANAPAPAALLPHLPLFRAAGLPVALGLYSFSFSGAACFPSIYVSMRDRRRFPRLLAGAFAAVAALYAVAAVAGLAAFGEQVSDQVTLSMRAMLPDAFSTRLATWLVVLSPLTKIALTLAPVAMAVEEILLVPPSVVAVRVGGGGGGGSGGGSRGGSVTHQVQQGQQQHQPQPQQRMLLRRRHQRGRKTRNALVSAALRTGLLAGCAAAAVSVPFFALLSQVIGAFMCLNISVVLPCLFYLRLRWRWAPKWALGLAGVVAICAEAGSVGATWHALSALAEKYGGGGGGGGGGEGSGG
jgi:vesicular inhibitory amino acid transporter